jgi:PAS domain S-box-containing protein
VGKRKDKSELGDTGQDHGSKYLDILKFLKYKKGIELSFHDSPIPKFLTDITTKKYLDVNPAFAEYTGFSKKEVVGYSAQELGLITVQQAKLIDNQVGQTHVKSFKAKFKTKNGQRKKILISLDQIDYNGKPVVLGEIFDLSELAKSQEALKLANEFSENLLNSMLEGLIIVSIEDQIIKVNPTICAMTGFTEEELVGTQKPFPFWPPEFLSDFNSQYAKLLEQDLHDRFEATYMRKNGQRFPVYVMLSRIKEAYGNVIANFATVVDLTESKKAEEKIKLAKEFADGLLETMDEGLSVIAKDGSPINVNRAFCNMTGFTCDELLNSNIPFPYWPPEHIVEIKKAFKKTLDGKGSRFQLTFMRKNGERFPVSIGASTVYDQNGDVLAFFATVQDLTERLQKENELRNAKQFSENILSSMLEGLAVVNKNNEITKVNPSFCMMTGYTETELKAATLPFPFWAPECYDNCFLHYDKLQKEGFNKVYETVYRRKNGDRFPVQIISTQLKDEAGETAAILATIQDITEQKKAQDEIRMAKEYSENLVLSLQEGLSVVSLDGIQIDVNPSLCKMTGFEKEELVGQHFPFCYWAPESYNDIKKAFAKTLSGEANKFEFLMMRKNGERFPVSVTTSYIKNKDGKTIANFATIQDITNEIKVKNKLSELAVRSKQKKEVILELAGLVGQDFKKALRKITALAAKTMNVERVSVWRFSKDLTEIVCEKLFNLSSGTFENGGVITKEDNPKYFDALYKNKTLGISDAINDNITKSFTKNYLKPYNISSMLDVFVNGLRGAYGIICFEHVGPTRIWSAEDEEFATSIANLVSLMVESNERNLAEVNLINLNEKLSSTVLELNELKNRLENENIYLKNELEMVFNFEEMVYGSAAFGEVLSNVEKVAPTDATVLLLGDSGTGKELLARAIHNLSPRKQKSLIKVNCAAIPRELIESELFGHKKGSFTGAVNDKIGKIELAHQGTLFLDEIGELPLSMQPKLLRFLQEGEIEKIGETATRKLDVRVIAATNKKLKKEVAKKRFREDLYFRLNVFPIHVPPLKDRKEDIPLLIEHFIDKFSKTYRKNIKYISESAMQSMQNYDWPGNIRELENLIERAVILSNSESLTFPDFDTSGEKNERRIENLNLTLDDVQKSHILNVLEKCEWKIDGEKGAAKALRIKPSTLRDRMKKFRINRPE